MFLFIALLFFIGCGSALDLSRQAQSPSILNDIHISSPHILKIIPIDVGQGDATLMIGDNNEGILIDTGLPMAAPRVLQTIEEQHVEISRILLSHPDQDHIGGLAEILKGLQQPNPPEVLNEKTTAFGTTMSLGEATISVKAAQGKIGSHLLTEEEKQETNNWSVALLLQFHHFKYFTTGDLPGGGGNPPYTTPDLESIIAPTIGDIDIAHISHHGSHTATNDFFLATLKPEAAIISTGDHNEYFHPHPSVIDRLLKSHIALYQTERGWLDEKQDEVNVIGGSICIQSDGETYSIRPYAIDKCR